ncbi:MAG: M48 family metalloprotease [Burkholderiaceae bacterium]
MQERHEAAGRGKAAVRRVGALESTLPPRYRRQAWLAVAALLVFIGLYAALAGWFLRKAWKLSFGSGAPQFFGLVAAACAALIAAFMIKGLFFIRRGKPEGLVALRREEQPRLFEFLHQLADDAGAPRPHKVYVSARVNAAVFYDLSLVNLLLPSRKNLEIGLSLVNALTLGELRAVLAHEFGHFGQRAMAVGRWVYVAHQVTAQLVARRDKLDAFVDGLSRSDFRIAWVGWVLQTIVWAIRSLIDLAFRGVLLLESALSREMELQADLVAVSLTGSDALVHALSKLRAADDSFDRAVGFAQGEQARGQPVADLFELHAHLIKRMAAILDDPLYGRVPLVPLADPGAHRVFRQELTQPPRMWQSHPQNHEREANAKKTYVPAPLDERSAWLLFDAAPALRERITRELLPPGDKPVAASAETLARVDARFERPSLQRRYQGVYFGRAVTRSVEDVEDLLRGATAGVGDLDGLYPKSLATNVERMRALDQELAQLRALDAGVVEASGGAIRYRGGDVPRRELPGLIERVVAERDEARTQLDAHEARVHQAHLAAARVVDAMAAPGQPTHEAALRGLLAALHYAEHGEAVARDLKAAMWVRYRMVTAGGKITHDKLVPLVNDCNQLQQAVDALHLERDKVMLSPAVLARLDSASWSEGLGKFDLPLASAQNIQKWLEVVDGWVDSSIAALGALRNAALDELLLQEQALAAQLRDGTPAPVAEAACVVPVRYRRLLMRHEQVRRVTLTWWQRFLRASGRGPAILRLAIAGGIVGTVLAVGANIGSAELVIYDGLGIPVRVQVGESRHDVEPGGAVKVDVEPDATLPVVTTTRDGREIERFDAKIEGGFGTQVYNVAGASALVRTTAVYGPATPQPPQVLGAPRLVSVAVDHLFSDPPSSVQTKHGEGAVRTVLRGTAGMAPGQALGVLRSDPAAMRHVALAHARWDPYRAGSIEDWFVAGMGDPAAPAVVAERLAREPDDVALRRIEQYLSPEGAAHAAVCARDQARALEKPDDGDRAYVALRCEDESAGRDAAFVAAHARWPANAWLAYGAAWALASDERWPEATAAFEQAGRGLPFMTDQSIVMQARILRAGGDAGARVQALARRSEQLAHWLAIEAPDYRAGDEDGPIAAAYADLAQGRLAVPAVGDRVERVDVARLARLAGASDGAPPALVQAALALPVADGLDGDTVWAALGLALRTHADTAPLVQALTDPARVSSSSSPAQLRRMWAVVQASAQPGAHALAAADLRGFDPAERGQVWMALAVALGDKAPPPYRTHANRLLFSIERPYFRTTTQQKGIKS